MFNSQTINNDPEPYIIDFGLALGMVRSSEDAGSHWDSHATYYDPRPEYDNNPNPILIYARNFLVTDLSDDPIQTLLTWLDSDWTQILWIVGSCKVVLDRIEHARKVLERLVNVYGSH